MSVQFVDTVVAPSGILSPNQLSTPNGIFIYGSNQTSNRNRRGSGTDSAITSEASEPLTTELDETLLFEPTA